MNESREAQEWAQLQCLVRSIYPNLDLIEAIQHLLSTNEQIRMHLLTLVEERANSQRRIRLLETSLECAITELRLANAGLPTVEHYTEVLGRKTNGRKA